MSLARSLLNGNYDSNNYSSMINSSKYTADCGAHVIAMESVEELHDIFLEEYNYEQADIAAISDGTVLEGSQYQAVAEASVKEVFSKVKAFFQKLWEKVKAFFHNVIRFFKSIFEDGKKFVKEYDKDIKGLISLKDLSMKIHKFDNTVIDKYASNDEHLTNLQDLTGDVNSAVGEIGRKITALGMNGEKDVFDKIVDDFKKSHDTEAYFKKYTKVSNMEEHVEQITKAIYGGDAEDTDITVSMVKDMAKVLANSSNNFESLQTKANSAYKAMLKVISDAEKKYEDEQYNDIRHYITSLFSAATSYFSTAQNIFNKDITIVKGAYTTRDREYKHVIVTALSKGNKDKK